MENEKPWNISDDGKYYIESLSQVKEFIKLDGEHIRVSWPITHYSKDGKYAYTEDGSCYQIEKGEKYARYK